MSYIEGTAERADLIKETVAAAREDTVAKGGVYGETDDLLYLYQTASGNTVTPYTVDRYQYAMDGSVYKITEDVALKLNDTGTRTRTPTGERPGRHAGAGTGDACDSGIRCAGRCACRRS